VPLQSADLPFVFREVTVDFQDVTIQGQLSYRVSDPKRIAALLDFSLGRDGRPASDALEVLRQRLVNATQALTRAVVQTRRLTDALVGLDSLEQDVRERIAGHAQVAMLGVEVLAVSIVSIKPTPEMGKALEAEAREELQREADAAVYDRRNAAVEHERRIKENELNTEIAVEEKRRMIREKKIAADIAIEEQRAALVDLELDNHKKTADGRGYALATSLEPLKGVDWKTLMAISPGGADVVIATAFRELAENASKIGELNISPDLLRTLLDGKKAP
jgi:regulator of protease activity HflC (stomatin/prohibitin superfamily)